MRNFLLHSLDCSDSFLHGYKHILKVIIVSWVPLIPALVKQVDWVQPCLHRECQDSQGYIEKSILKIKHCYHHFPKKLLKLPAMRKPTFWNFKMQSWMILSLYNLNSKQNKTTKKAKLVFFNKWKEGSYDLSTPDTEMRRSWTGGWQPGLHSNMVPPPQKRWNWGRREQSELQIQWLTGWQWLS